MKVSLLTIGKTDVGWVRESLETYISRLVHYVPFTMIEIPELKNTSSLTKEQIKDKEGKLFLKNIRPADKVILLDEHGADRSSMEFSKEIGGMMSAGRDVIFVIGGAYGFSPEMYSRSDGKISLSRMTFPHQMVRTIFVEQLYRAFTILMGEPYHHE